MSSHGRRILLTLLSAVVPHVCGAQATPKSDPPIRPFTIAIPDPVLADLKVRLKNPRIPEALQGDGWTYGTDIV